MAQRRPSGRHQVHVGRSGHKSSLGDHLGLVGEPEFLEGQHRTRFGERMHRGEYFEETAGAMVEKDYLH
jgi:hypothetical protein